MCAAKSRAARTKEIIQILFAAGASVDASDSQGQTALMYAAQGDSADAIKALAAAGASINARDNRGRTALHGFARHGQRVAAFKALLEAGADMNASDTAGVTVLLAAIKAFSAEAARLIMAVGEDSAAEVAAASRTNPTPLDLMLFENGSNWLQCNIEASAIVELIGELAAAGCPVDTRLPARCGDPGLQPSTLETWLARLAKHGWPASPDDRDKVLQFSRVLLSSAAAQGSQGRPELLAAAEAVGSPELVAAVQKILPVVEASPNSTAAAMPRDQPIAGDKRRPGRRRSRKPKASASTSHQPVPRPAPAALRTSQLARGRFSGASARLRARPALPFTLPLALVGFAGCF